MLRYNEILHFLDMAKLYEINNFRTLTHIQSYIPAFKCVSVLNRLVVRESGIKCYSISLHIILPNDYISSSADILQYFFGMTDYPTKKYQAFFFLILL